MLGKDYQRQDCSIARTLEVIGERWTLLIVRDAFYGVQRFNDFQAHLDIPKAVLSDRLTGLVKNGILERQPDPSHAGRHLYELSAPGRDLWPVLHALLVWGDHHRHPNSRLFQHAACGTELNDSGYCPACDATPHPEDILTKPRRGRGKLRTTTDRVADRDHSDGARRLSRAQVGDHRCHANGHLTYLASRSPTGLLGAARDTLNASATSFASSARGA